MIKDSVPLSSDLFGNIDHDYNKDNDNLIIESIGRYIQKDFSKTAVVHARNAVILADIINADIITNEKDMYLAEGKTYKNIICSYASPYMKYKTLIPIIRKNKDAKLWWFVNDHDLEDNILLRNILIETKGKRKINMICNNSRENYRGWILRKKIKDGKNILGLLNDFIFEWHTLNLNALIFQYCTGYNYKDKTRDLVYYGTMRKWRLEYLKEYQDESFDLSTSKKIQKKFVLNGVDKYHLVDKLNWKIGEEELKRYKFSLYIEDLHTHTHYAYMANRFYEALMCNVISIFDINCADNIKKSGYKIDKKFIVKNKEELLMLVKELSDKDSFEKALALNKPLIEQAKKEHKEIVNQLKKIFK